MKPKATKVFFSIDPDYLTSLIRDLWAEGSYQKSFNIIQSAFPTMQSTLYFDLISGKKKLTHSASDNIMSVIADTWLPDLTRCFYSQYPDPKEVRNNSVYTGRDWIDFQKTKGNDLRSKRDRALDEIVENAADLDLTLEEYRDFSNKGLEHIPSPAKIKMQIFSGYDSLEDMNQAYLIQKNLPTVESIAAAQISRAERERKKPKPDTKFEGRSGWILPNGKFYACLTAMEHIWLAEQFGFTETQAEYKGWIKISRDLYGDYNILKYNKKDPTQKQINTITAFCEKHNISLPDWFDDEI